MISALVGLLVVVSVLPPFANLLAIAKSDSIQNTVQYGMDIESSVFIVAMCAPTIKMTNEFQQSSNLFVLAGAVLLIPVVLILLATVPGLEGNQCSRYKYHCISVEARNVFWPVVYGWMFVGSFRRFLPLCAKNLKSDR